MKRTLITLMLLTVFAGLMLAGCAGTAPTPEVPTVPEAAEAPAVSETEAPVAEELNLQTLYQQGIDVISQMGDSAPILFPETNIEYMENFYPGLASVELKQFYAGVAPVTNAPFEIILTEVANEEDVQVLLDIFQTRADEQSKDTTYPENAAAWMNNCKITSRGNYVFLAVLMDPCEIPAEFILD